MNLPSLMVKTTCYVMVMGLLLLITASSSLAQQTTRGNLDDSVMTIAGELKIVEKESVCKFDITLNGKRIFSTDCEAEEKELFPIPTIHTVYKSAGVYPFDEVVLLQLNMLGNACNGGPLIFLGLKHDGSFQFSSAIDFCGGRAPIITWSSSKVTVLIPGGPPNRGKGYIPAETWVYENGKVKKVTGSRKTK